MNPEHGFLVGEVASRTGSGIELVDPNRVTWQVTFDTAVSTTTQEALTEGERVGLRGSVTDPVAYSFLACDLRSLEFEGDPHLLQPPHPRMGAERNPPLMRSTSCGDVRPLDQN
jgi:hypothetical protein